MKVLTRMVESGNIEGVRSMLKKITAEHMQPSESPVWQAAADGRIDMLQLLEEHRFPLTIYALTHAARNAKMPMIRYILKRNGRWFDESQIAAIRSNDLEVVKLAFAPDAPIDSTFLAPERALREGTAPHSFPVFAGDLSFLYVVVAAIAENKVFALRYFLEELRYPWTRDLPVIAASCGSIDTLRYLCEKHRSDPKEFPLEHKRLAIAGVHGKNAQCLQYLHEKFLPPVQVDWSDMLNRNCSLERLDVVMYLIEQCGAKVGHTGVNRCTNREVKEVLLKFSAEQTNKKHQ